MDKLNIIHYFLYKLNYLYRAVLLMLLLSVVYLFMKENGKKAKEKIIEILKHGWLAGFLFYLALILTSTVFVRGVQTPYRTLIGCFGLRDDPEWNFEILRNILLFVPYTFLYIKAFNPAKVWKSTLILSIVTTVFIELSQLLFWLGECQLSDIVHNILGGMIGCGIWCMIDKKLFVRLWNCIKRIFHKDQYEKYDTSEHAQ